MFTQSSTLPLRRRSPSWADGSVAESHAMQQLLNQIEKVAPSSLSVLFSGETGTGKDVMARALHAASGRTGPFVVVNCAALPYALAERELFGHVRGAFTGADHKAPGLIEAAHRGTLLLDEAGELDLGVQSKLLRVIEDGVIRMVGATGTSTVDVRFVAATHRDLASAVDVGAFREDLYFRLAGIVLTVPPLRDRPEDIEPLARRFLIAESAGRAVPSMTDGALECLRRRRWRGNVRELRQSIRRAVALGGAVLTAEDFAVAEVATLTPSSASRRPVDKTWSDIEREVFTAALARHGSARAAATALGIARSTFCDRLLRLGIREKSSRSITAAYDHGAIHAAGATALHDK